MEHKEIAGALLSSLATAQIHPDRISIVISDEGSTVVAATKHVLQHVWRNAWWFLCWSHKLASIGDILPKHKVFSMINLLYRSLAVVRVPMQPSAADADGESALPSLPVLVILGGCHGEMVPIDVVKIGRARKDFVVVDAGKTKRNEENLSPLHTPFRIFYCIFCCTFRIFPLFFLCKFWRPHPPPPPRPIPIKPQSDKKQF